MQRTDDDRARFAQWFVFHEFENREYSRQRCLTKYKLFKTQDVIDLFSNHAQSHVEEVMEQCLMMFRVLQEWILARLPEADSEELLRHLLTAAKLHDICMSPSLQLLESLNVTDRMYESVLAGHADPERLRSRYMELKRLTAETGLAGSPKLRLIGALCTMAAPGRETAGKLADALAAYHDEIKQYSRKNHAALGALYVLEHAQTIRAHYGEGLDIAMVASIIALHSTSSTECKAIGFDDEAARRDTLNCLKPLFAGRETELPRSGDWLNQAVTLASLLRLADARRSGSRLTMLDDARLLCLADGERMDLLIETESGAKRITNHLTHDILLSEYCTDFEGMRLCRDDDGWKIIHQLVVREWQHEEVWRLFCSVRLESYIDEIMTAGLKPGRFIRHQLDIRLAGDGPAEKKRAAAAYKTAHKNIEVTFQGNFL